MKEFDIQLQYLWINRLSLYRNYFINCHFHGSHGFATPHKISSALLCKNSYEN